ncbi:MAG: pyrimidine reductase family protein [Gordonia sp. (in: high G+C Gram-positive bacteria)]|uniref:pyrimidine reductase family protein n=1 Tax=Gordonia sp. (in: high G+C Gram-positive bacteria) TaxID=84139 RepID=UPI0039E70DBF
MQILRKASEVTPDDLAGLYAHPVPDEPRRAWVRANMIASVDGGAGLEGRSGELGGDGDRQIFALLRSLADVVVVGAHTATTEGYGQPDGPVLALVSRSLNIPDDYTPAADAGTVVFTCTGAPADRRAALSAAGATLVDCGTDTVDPAALVVACVARGWRRVLLEGGPRLLGSFVDAGALDELCLTTAPVLLGGDAVRPVVGAREAMRSMSRAHLLADEEGYTYARWVRSPDDSHHDSPDTSG